jgi:hypothetical protein
VSRRLRSSGYLHLGTAGINDLFVRKDEELLIANFRAWEGSRRTFWARAPIATDYGIGEP